MLICLLFEVLLSKRKLLNVTRYSCFSVLYLLYYKIYPPVSPFYHSIQLYKEKISDSLFLFVEEFPEPNIYNNVSLRVNINGAVRVGFCPVIIKTKGKSRSVNQFLLPKGLLPVYMLLCEQRLDILPL